MYAHQLFRVSFSMAQKNANAFDRWAYKRGADKHGKSKGGQGKWHY